MDLLLEETKIQTLLMWLTLLSSQLFLIFSLTLPHSSFFALKLFINTN